MSRALYPPPHHLETDPAKLFRVIREYPLATLISQGEAGSLATHLPLVGYRNRGAQGVLVGHIDRENPQCGCLDGQEALAVFQGPTCYISPTVYASAQLPTWNYVIVHARGIVRPMGSVDELRDALIRMVQQLEPAGDGFVLKPDNDRMRQLLGGIVGFTIEIKSLVGRFKLSQDKSEEDLLRAKEQLIRQSQKSARSFIESMI